MTPEPLTDADKDAALWLAVDRRYADRYDTRWGTAEAAKRIKAGEFRTGCGYAFGTVGPCEDGPYSEWSRWLDGTPKGIQVTVYRKRDGKHESVARRGLMSWNELANRCTCRLARERHQAGAEPLPGEQLTLV